MSMKCMYTNACSVIGKMDELRYVAQNEDYSVIGITETWGNETINDAELHIEGYTMFRKDRKSMLQRRGGGVVLYVKDTLRPRPSSKLGASEFEESVWCTIDLADSPLLVGVCYRSTSSSDDNNDKLLELLQIAADESKSSQLLLMGDFNYPEINYNDYMVTTGEDSPSSKFFNCTQDLFLCQHVTNCTRHRDGQKSSILDYIFTCEENEISDILYEPPLGKSDHCCLHFEYMIKDHNVTEFELQKLNYWKGDFSSMRKALSEIDWQTMLSGKTVEEMWTYFKGTLQSLCASYVPHRNTTNRNTKKRTWMTKATKKLLKRRESAWRRYKKVCSTSNYEEYKALRNKVCSAIQKDKANFQLQLVKSFKGNPKRFYGYVRSMQTVRTKVGALQKIDGGKTVTDKETAEVLSAHFQDVFVTEIDADDVNCDDPGTTALLEVQFDEHVVLKKLNRLKPDKSQGPDEVHPMVLLRTADEVAKPLSIIFESSYRQGILPADWKCANISPIFKKGSKSDANNYRPVSLTSVPCKIMESIIRDVLVTHMENNNLITAHQHGFMTGRSCLTNLLETLESWSRILDNGFGIDVIYLDYRKAFDTVPHNRLISKLQGCGIDGPLLHWIRAFLADRSMRVMVNDSSSSWANVSSGVPQGSVLGPLLFLIFVNDLPDWVKSSIKMFADDTKLWTKISNTADSEMLQEDLNRLKCWSDKWLLRFNPEKCKVMHVGHSVPTEYSLLEKDQPIKLAEVEEEKDFWNIYYE